jgi:thioredoxin-dependent peroxiredoxin
MNTIAMFLSVGAVASSLCSFAAAAQTTTKLKPGDPAPDFTLQGTDGKTYKLSDFRGQKAVVLAWFPKAFTPGCTAECKSLRSEGGDLRKFEVAYFTASCDDVETNKRFAESLGLDYPILSDPSRETAKAYGVVSGDKKNAARTTFYIGKDGRILFVDDNVKAGSHGSDVAARLRELSVPEKGR